MIVARRDDTLHARLEESRDLPAVHAGSGLLRLDDTLLAIQDDAAALVRIRLADWRCEPIVLEGDGTPMPKSEKPDFEAAFLAPGGEVFMLGSGSTPQRTRIAMLSPDLRSWSLQAVPEVYRAVHEALGTMPNIEGAALEGERLRLFHRGSGGAASAEVQIAFRVGTGPTSHVLGVRWYDLGRLQGVALSFTDVAALGSDRLIYLAVAEDTPNAIEDGPIVGAAVGVLAEGDARWTPIQEADGSISVRKFEGLALAPDGRSAYLITDPDSSTVASQLCRVALTGL